jgi:thiol-disulfide isomerase/thioredoxin
MAPPRGQPAPSLRLPDLDGKTVDLATFKGEATLVIFWNPGCGFCQRMLPEIRALEAQPPLNAPQLLIVSTGTIEANRAMGVQSTIVLDNGFTNSRMFGATGTPSAILVDAQGDIASDLAIGAQAVLALAGVRHVEATPGILFAR